MNMAVFFVITLLILQIITALGIAALFVITKHGNFDVLKRLQEMSREPELSLEYLPTKISWPEVMFVSKPACKLSLKTVVSA